VWVSGSLVSALVNPLWRLLVATWADAMQQPRGLGPLFLVDFVAYSRGKFDLLQNYLMASALSLEQYKQTRVRPARRRAWITYCMYARTHWYLNVALLAGIFTCTSRKARRSLRYLTLLFCATALSHELR
jgi:hypothetical protein